MLSLNVVSAQVYNPPSFKGGAPAKLIKETLIKKGWSPKGATMFLRDQIPTVKFIQDTFKFGKYDQVSVEECKKLQAGRIRKLLEQVQAKDF